MLGVVFDKYRSVAALREDILANNATPQMVRYTSANPTRCAF